MKYARYISESQIAFPPPSKYIDGRLVLGYDQRADLLAEDGYKPYVEEAPRPPAGFVVDAWQYIDDGSTIRKQYTYSPVVPLDAQETTAAIIARIAQVVVAYDAVEDVKLLEDVNIENLLALAATKGVTDADMAALKGDIVMLKTDLEGKMDANWYTIWHSWLKQAITDAMQNISEQVEESEEGAEEDVQE